MENMPTIWINIRSSIIFPIKITITWGIWKSFTHENGIFSAPDTIERSSHCMEPCPEGNSTVVLEWLLCLANLPTIIGISFILIGICYGMVNLAFQTNSYCYGIHNQWWYVGVLSHQGPQVIIHVCSFAKETNGKQGYPCFGKHPNGCKWILMEIAPYFMMGGYN